MPNRNQFSVDYKQVGFLRRCLSTNGRILPRTVTRITGRQQTHMSRAVKRARMIAILPFVLKLR